MRRSTTLAACAAALLLQTGLATAQSGAQTEQAPYSSRPSQDSDQVGEPERLTAQDFVQLAATSILFDIEAASLAGQRAQDGGVRAFAGRLLADRRAALEDLRRAAGGAQVPAELDDDNRRIVDALAGEQGAEFDTAFVGMMVDAQEDAIDLYEEFAESADDDALEDFVNARLETLRALVEEARQLDASLSSAAQGAPGAR